MVGRDPEHFWENLSIVDSEPRIGVDIRKLSNIENKFDQRVCSANMIKHGWSSKTRGLAIGVNNCVNKGVRGVIKQERKQDDARAVRQ